MKTSLLLFIIAAAFFCIAIYMYKRSMNFQKKGVRVDALITSVDARKHKRKNRYYPVFSYQANGQEYTTHGAHAGSKWKNSVNTYYPIVYDPAAPSRIQVVDFNGVLFWTCAFTCVGAIFLSIAFWKAWFYQFIQ